VRGGDVVDEVAVGEGAASEVEEVAPLSGRVYQGCALGWGVLTNLNGWGSSLSSIMRVVCP